MIQITDKTKCCGCTACATTCPTGAITMIPDEEGFLYPRVSEEKCVNCGLCEKRCPVLNAQETKDEEIRFYVARAKDRQVLEASTSGGFVTPVAEYVFSQGGVVCGAVFDEYLNVVHQVFEPSQQEQALRKMRGSKYVQSDICGIFEKLKHHLETGKPVLFVGTPCQVYGLKAWLHTEYQNLITIALVCHGVPSSMLWKKYVAYQEKKYRSKIKSVMFRNKTYGYHSGTMKLEFENGKTYYGSARVDYMLKSFFSEISSRPSCYHCAFKGISSISDFTIYDCWRPSAMIDSFRDDDCGYTNVITHSKKAVVILGKLSERYELSEVDMYRALRFVGTMVIKSARPHIRRKEFYVDLNKNSLDSHINQFIPVTYKDIIVEKTKPLLYKLGMFGYVKQVKKWRKR